MPAFAILAMMLLTIVSMTAQAAEPAFVGSVPAKISSGDAVRLADLADTVPIEITVVLMPHRDALARYADDVNDPTSQQFHHYLTLPQLKQRFMPSDADLDQVLTWAKTGGLSEVKHWTTNHALVVRGTVKQVDALLGIKLSKYRLKDETFFGNDKTPSIPSDLTGKVADILGLNSIERFEPDMVNPSPTRVLDKPEITTGAYVTRSTLDGNVDGTRVIGRLQPSITIPKPAISGPFPTVIEPQDLWSPEAYNYAGLARFSHCCNPGHLPSGSPPQTSIAVIASDKPDPKDYTGFFRLYNLAWNITTTTIGSPRCCDKETTMDVEWVTAMSNSLGASSDTAHVFLYSGDSGIHGILHAWEQALDENKTRVATTSFTYIEGAFGGLSEPSISDFTDVTRSMTAMGWTLVSSSGDQGGDANCEVRGSVKYPATDPNVVAAGGTALGLGSPLSFTGETAWQGNGCANPGQKNGGGGGGGCSDTFPATSWNPNGCTRNRRAIPDMALNAATGQAFYYSYNKPACSLSRGSDGKVFPICPAGGTSLVAPELAGFFAQENAYLLTLGNICGPSHDAGCAPLGRAAPFLFAAVTAPHDPFYDVTMGCTGNGQSPGWCAGPGYDLATGLGSANMMQLAWAINHSLLSAGSTPPIVHFSGAHPGTLYTGPVTVSFDIEAANRGVAGSTWIVGRDPGDPTTEPAPRTSSADAYNPFWDGPQHLGGRGDSVTLPFKEGCQTVYARAWDNLGVASTPANSGLICMGTPAEKCSLAVGACPRGGGQQAFTVSCGQTMSFSVDGAFKAEATHFSGQEKQASLNTFVNACVPGTANCQGFNTAATETCPINGGGGGGGGTTTVKNCSVCTERGQTCVRVPGGFECKGVIQ